MGSGFALDMISRLRQNRSLRGKSDYASLKKASLNYAAKEGFEYKTASKEQLEFIRQKIVLQKKHESQRIIKTYIISFFVGLGLISAIVYLLKHFFFS